ncbi:MAG: hypothetical protein U0359_04655 [Byssovorax sp.]
MSEETAQKIRDNPFYVLGLRPEATRAEVERQGAKLLSMLELQLKSAATYRTPLGVFPRTADSVRRAMAELRDPSARLGHELWARLDPARVTAPGEEPEVDGGATAHDDEERPRADAPWPEAFAALGFQAER